MAHSSRADCGVGRDCIAQAADAQARRRAGYRLAELFAAAFARRFWPRCCWMGAWCGRSRVRQLRLAPLRLLQRRPWLGARSARRHHAGDGQLRRAAHLYLLRRLHGPRRKLHTLLLLPLALCRSDARRGHLQQHSAALHVLGDGWAYVVSADRLLVSKAVGRGSSQKGIHYHARRRRFLPARNRLALFADRHAALL